MGNYYEIVNLKGEDKKIFNLDFKYRYPRMYKYYQFDKQNSVNDFLYFFCCHYSKSKLSKQIKPFFEDGSFNNLSFIEKFLKLCDVFSVDIKKEFEKFPKDLRSKNIRLVNNKQEKVICENKGNYFFDTEITSKVKNLIQLGKIKLIDRTLVLYFRDRSYGEEQVDYMEFSIMYYILDWYINQGYSKLFNNLVVISRNEDGYPKFLNYIFENFSFKNVNINFDNYENFLISAGLASNLVHFVDGNYQEVFDSSFSTQIVSESHGKNQWVLNKNNFVKLKGISFDRMNDNIKNQGFFEQIFFNDKREKNNGDFYKLMKSVLDAVVELENKLIKEANNN